MTEPLALYEVSDGVALVTLNRPDRMNAWTAPLEIDFYNQLDRAVADDAVRVIVITGAGKGFCPGADTDALIEIRDTPGGAAAIGIGVQRPPYYISTLPKPVIAAINGACAGVGLVQALWCDLRFVAANAKLTAAFARRGLVAEWGAAWVLPRLVGLARAADVLYSSRVITASEALELGLVNRVCEPDQLMADVMAYATDLAANCAPSSMAAMKRQLWGYADWNAVDADADTSRLMVSAFAGADFAEGVASYLEKRSPSFGPAQAWATELRSR